MPTVVVVLPSNTYKAADFVEAAVSLGIDLVVASENEPPIDMGDRYLTIDCENTESAAEIIATHGETVPLDAVVAADEGGVMVAARASEMLGLTGNRPEAAILTRDKLAMRTRLQIAEVDQPGFAALLSDDDPQAIAAGVGVPLIIKPIDRTASQGVIRVDRLEDVGPTANRVRDIVGHDATLLIESFAPGTEIAIEGLVSHGSLYVLAVFDKPDTRSGPFFPETIFVTPSRLAEDVLAEAVRVAGSSVRALGLTNGPVHVELRVDGSRARLIEIAARSIGGLCSRSLDFGLMDTSLESLILRNALDGAPPHLRRRPMANGVLMIPTPADGRFAGLRGEAEVRALEEITGIDITAVKGQRLLAPPDGDMYVGFVYARGHHPEQVESALRKAMANLEVQLEG